MRRITVFVDAATEFADPQHVSQSKGEKEQIKNKC